MPKHWQLSGNLTTLIFQEYIVDRFSSAMKNLIENSTSNGLPESLGWRRPKFEVGFGMENLAEEDQSVRWVKEWVKELRKGK